MCDCPPEDKGASLDETVSLLFERCPRANTDDTRTSRDPAKVPADAHWQTPRTEACCDDFKKSTSSDCSSESTRNYKFVEPWEFEYLSCGEEELPERSPMAREPCTTVEGEDEPEEEEPDIECTLALVKPEAVACRRAIEERIFEEGFEVYQTRWLQLSPEQVSEFYADNYGRTNFAHLVAYMASGPIVAMVLAKHRAVQDWRLLMGPTKVTEARLYFPDSIRARYGRRGEDFKNAVHGSVSREHAEREIHFFFPEFIVEPLPRGERAAEYLWEVVNSVLLEGLALCCKVKPIDPILWLANWLISNNPNGPKLPEDLAVIPH